MSRSVTCLLFFLVALTGCAFPRATRMATPRGTPPDVRLVAAGEPTSSGAGTVSLFRTRGGAFCYRPNLYFIATDASGPFAWWRSQRGTSEFHAIVVPTISEADFAAVRTFLSGDPTVVPCTSFLRSVAWTQQDVFPNASIEFLSAQIPSGTTMLSVRMVGPRDELERAHDLIRSPSGLAGTATMQLQGQTDSFSTTIVLRE